MIAFDQTLSNILEHILKKIACNTHFPLLRTRKLKYLENEIHSRELVTKTNHSSTIYDRCWRSWTQSIPLDLDASFSRFSSSVHKRHLVGLSNEILADKDVRGLDSRRSLRSSEE